MLSRRPATLGVAALLLIALGAMAALLPVPYVILGPGPTENTLGSYSGTPVVSIEGRRTYPTSGELDLTTVGVTSAGAQVDLLTAFQAWVDPVEAVVPRGRIYPEDVSAEQVDRQNVEQMERSQEDAKVAALRAVGVRVPEVVVVDAVVEGAPAQGRLHAGDIVRAVDGQAVRDPQEVADAVTAHRPGERVNFVVERAGRRVSVRVPTVRSDDGGESRAVVGIAPAVGYDLPVRVEIALGEEIGGPSAGLVFALAIIDKLTPGALTGGLHVAGTGTVTPEGEVGPIGGIEQKIFGARDGGATFFLAPAANCAVAAAVDAEGIQVVRVASVEEARTVLERIAAGDTTALPACA